MSDTGRSPGRAARAGSGGATVRQRRGGTFAGRFLINFFLYFICQNLKGFVKLLVHFICFLLFSHS